MRIKKINIFLLTLISFTFFSISSCYAQEKLFREKIISGRVIDTISMKPLPDIIIVNKRSNKVTISDKEGLYYIWVANSDSLFFYSVGYFPKILILVEVKDIEKKLVPVYMKPNVQEMEEIQITAIRKGQKQSDYKYPFNQSPADIQSPLTFLYEKYSKKYQQYRKVEELERKKYYKQMLEARYNREFVMQITEAKEDEVDVFMKRYKLSNDFIEHASDYDFILAIQKNYRSFKAPRRDY